MGKLENADTSKEEKAEFHKPVDQRGSQIPQCMFFQIFLYFMDASYTQTHIFTKTG